jgi:hypothetical protein
VAYDKTIEILNRAINRSAIDRSEKVEAFATIASHLVNEHVPRGVVP